MRLRTLSNISVKGKRILLRIDVNAGIYNQKPIDSPRFEAHAKTIKKFSKEGAQVVVIAHQGRKGGSDFVANLKWHAKLLEKHSGVKINYINGLFDSKVVNKLSNMKNKEVIMLKNVRCYEDEEKIGNKNNRYIQFSKNFDIYVNDAFSVCHRNQGSIVIPPRVIPGYSGPVLYEEFTSLEKFNIVRTKKKVLFILGGAKIKEFTPIAKMLKRGNFRIAAGGLLGNLVLYDDKVAMGYENHLLKQIGYLKLGINRAIKKYRKRIIAPIDVSINDRGRKDISLDKFPINKRIMDIGDNTVKIFEEQMKYADIIVMKGPLGVSEIPEFGISTEKILKKISALTIKGIKSLISGGNLTTTITQYNIRKKFSYVSLSGGAMIEFICGSKLPGLEVLRDRS